MCKWQQLITLCKNTDKIIPESILDIHYKTEILERKSIIDKEEKGYSCYTDGSKNDKNQTGYGYIIYNNANNEKTTLLQKSRKLVNECTVFQAEMLAIQEVAEILIINQTTGDRKRNTHT